MIATNIPPIEQFKNLIFQQANRAYAKLPDPKPLEIDDLVSECAVAYCEARDRFDPARAKFFTFFHLRLRQHLGGVVRKQIRQIRDTWAHAPDELVFDRPIPPEPPTGRLSDRLANCRMSRTAWLVLRDMVSDGSPTNVVGSQRNRSWRRLLREKYGLNGPALQAVLSEIGNVVSGRGGWYADREGKTV